MLTENNFYGLLLTELFKRLQTAVPDLAWIAEDYGQLDLGEDAPPVAFPCALIDFPSTSFSELSDLEQTGEVTIDVKLAFNAHAEAYSVAPESHLNASVKRFDTEQKVYTALHGWAVEKKFQGLSRTGVSTERRADGCKVRVLRFTTWYQDQCASPENTKIPVSISTTGRIY